MPLGGWAQYSRLEANLSRWCLLLRSHWPIGIVKVSLRMDPVQYVAGHYIVQWVCPTWWTYYMSKTMAFVPVAHLGQYKVRKSSCTTVGHQYVPWMLISEWSKPYTVPNDVNWDLNLCMYVSYVRENERYVLQEHARDFVQVSSTKPMTYLLGASLGFVGKTYSNWGMDFGVLKLVMQTG